MPKILNWLVITFRAFISQYGLRCFVSHVRGVHFVPRAYPILTAVCSVLILITLVTPSLAQSPDEVPAVKPNQQRMQYDVYAGGIHALQAKLDMDLSEKDRFDIHLWAKTYGLLGKLAPWHGTFESHGWQGKTNKPQLHKSTAVWRGEEDIKEYKYAKDGKFLEYRLTDDENDGSPREVDDKLTQNTSDVLTATLNTMQAIAGGSKCEGETEIFDGKRRYKLIFKHKGEVTLEASRYNVYAGPAVECSAEVEPMAGKWHDKPRGWLSIQEQGRELGKIPTVWFAQITEGQPAVPVKVLVKTSYGTLFMHITDYEGGEKKLTLKD